MEWHLKNLLTPKLGSHYENFMKKVEVPKDEVSESEERKEEEKQPSCVICGRPATTAGYCDEHL